MIIHDAPQGSDAWMAARLGIPTASEFSRLVTSKGALSTQRDGYLAELLAEWALGQPVTEFQGNFATEWGQTMEPRAFDYFSFHADRAPRKVGIVYADESRMVGASPDFMVDDEPGELKCEHKPGIHLVRLMRGVVPREYHAQTQGQLWVTGAERGWFMSFYPELPPLLVRTERDETFQRALDNALPSFVDEVLSGRERLVQMGIEPVQAA